MINFKVTHMPYYTKLRVFENSYIVKIFFAVVLIWFGQTFFSDCFRGFFLYLYFYFSEVMTRKSYSTIYTKELIYTIEIMQ